MIAIGFDHFFILLNVVSMLIIGGFWARDLWRESHDDWNVSEDSLCRCGNCGLIFVSKRVEGTVTRCPSCDDLIRIRSKKSQKKMTY